MDPNRRRRRPRWDCGAIGRRVQSADAWEHRAVRAAAGDRDAPATVRIAAAVERQRAPILHSRPCASRLISTASWRICTAHLWRRRAGCIPSSTRPRSARRKSDPRLMTTLRRHRSRPHCHVDERRAVAASLAVWRTTDVTGLWESLQEIELGMIGRLAELAEERRWRCCSSRAGRNQGRQ